MNMSHITTKTHAVNESVLRYESGAASAKVAKCFHSTCAQDTQPATGSWSQVRFLLVHDADVAQETAVPAMPYLRVAAGLLMTHHRAD